MDRALRPLGLSPEDREDVRQQAFEEYLRNIQNIRNPGAWIALVAYRKGIRRKTDNRLVLFELEPSRDWPEEVRVDVRRAIDRMSACNGRLIFERFVEGHTIDDLVLGGLSGSASTVKRRLRRALATFERQLDELE